MEHRIDDIARLLNAETWGDTSEVVTGVAQPDLARAGELALAMDPKFAEAIQKGAASAAILWQGADPKEYGLTSAIFAPRSRYALSGVTQMFFDPPELAPGIHATAIIDPSAQVAADASIGPFVVIGPRVQIGKNAKIYSHTSILDDTILGDDALIYPGVRIGQSCVIGHGFVCQSGAVIGADGFSYVTPNPSAAEEARAKGMISETQTDNAYVRIDSLGGVRIGDHVEIGGNTCVDRGTVIDTVIGDGTKVDNQVQIGHNVQIGKDCLLCGQSGVAGSAKIGDRVVLGGRVAVADHLVVGSDVVAGGAAGIASNVPSGRIMMGNPAMPRDLYVESYKALRRLPRTLKRLMKDTE